MDRLSAALGKGPALAGGIVAGAIGAVVTALAMAASRYWLGIMPPPESVPDRIAPMLDIETFFSLFQRYGGYNGLKQFGILSGIQGLLVAGIVVGVIYALVLESGVSRRSPHWYLGVSRPAWLLIIFAVLVAWVGFVSFLWPVLPANYRGVPYTTARLLSISALLLWYSLFAATIMVSYRLLTIRGAPADRSTQEESSEAGPSSRPVSRRAVVAAATGGALVWPLHSLLQRMYADATFAYDGRPYSGEDIEPVTPIPRFYTVTKNVVDPDVVRDRWRLEIGGATDRDLTLSYDDLMGFEQVEQESTLMCISNRIGAGLISNARWQGVRLRDVLMAAGVRGDAYELKLTGADAYVDTFDLDYALNETTLIVYGINGEPLPRIHGYPVRIIVPGLYGEKNIKWVTRIDVVTEPHQGFYEQQGWGPNFGPPTRSDIFRPRTNGAGQSATFLQPIAAGSIVDLRGRAFAADRGIRSVEVTTNDGESWAPATIYYPGTMLTWALWRFAWSPAAPGKYRVYSRAIDGNGDPQPSEPRGIIPEGARGYNIVTATVVDA
jgi:DMSO/TMAO reductase YedYZ molybdopterin-dependent catalytic subunit